MESASVALLVGWTAGVTPEAPGLLTGDEEGLDSGSWALGARPLAQERSRRRDEAHATARARAIPPSPGPRRAVRRARRVRRPPRARGGCARGARLHHRAGRVRPERELGGHRRPRRGPRLRHLHPAVDREGAGRRDPEAHEGSGPDHRELPLAPQSLVRKPGDPRCLPRRRGHHQRGESPAAPDHCRHLEATLRGRAQAEPDRSPGARVPRGGGGGEDAVSDRDLRGPARPVPWRTRSG